MTIDPVCGMEVDEEQAAAQYEYKGKTYYFCAVGCKDKFVQNPEQYVKKRRRDNSKHSLKVRREDGDEKNIAMDIGWYDGGPFPPGWRCPGPMARSRV